MPIGRGVVSECGWCGLSLPLVVVRPLVCLLLSSACVPSFRDTRCHSSSCPASFPSSCAYQPLSPRLPPSPRAPGSIPSCTSSSPYVPARPPFLWLSSLPHPLSCGGPHRASGTQQQQVATDSFNRAPLRSPGVRFTPRARQTSDATIMCSRVPGMLDIPSHPRRLASGIFKGAPRAVPRVLALPPGTPRP